MLYFKKINILLFINMQILAFYDESNILDLIKQHIPPAPIILEAGAHHGEDTVKMKNAWPQSIIHAFEPHPDNYQRLINTVRRYKGILHYPFALSDMIGSAKFYRCRMHDGASSLLQSSLFKRNIYNDHEPILVQCLTLDAWAQRYNVDHIDFCWLDMEGMEGRMLKASHVILPTIKVIYIEVNFQEFRKGMVQYHDIKSFLEESGFTQIWMTPGKTAVPEDQQANALFVRNDLLHKHRS